MAHDPELVERARTLRRAGLSVSAIAVVVGIPYSTVRHWLAGIPAPAWTTRPNARDADRARAREMRLAGSTYDQIARQLVVSKSTVSLWVRDLPHPERSPQGMARRIAGVQRAAAARRACAAVERAKEVRTARDSLGALSDRELLVAGVVAYWAEGGKNKPWRITDRVSFINSDPGMIALFLDFLTAMGVDRARLRFRVSIHESADEAAAREYWGAVVKVPAADFMRSTLKRHHPTTRHNTGAEYHGCLSIDVLRPRPLYRAIEGMWQAVEASASRVTEQQSRVV